MGCQGSYKSASYKKSYPLYHCSSLNFYLYGKGRVAGTFVLLKILSHNLILREGCGSFPELFLPIQWCRRIGEAQKSCTMMYKATLSSELVVVCRGPSSTGKFTWCSAIVFKAPSTCCLWRRAMKLSQSLPFGPSSFLVLFQFQGTICNVRNQTLIQLYIRHMPTYMLLLLPRPP